MADIFNRRSMITKQSFAADSAFFSFDGFPAQNVNGVGLLVQNMQFQYAQPVTRLYELGTVNVYYVVGRPQGQGGIGRIIGPGGVVFGFYKKYGDVCKASSNVINIAVTKECRGADAPANPAADAVRYCITGIVVTSVGLSVAAQDMVFSEQGGFIFNGLDICENATIATAGPDSASCCVTQSVLVPGP